LTREEKLDKIKKWFKIKKWLKVNNLPYHDIKENIEVNKLIKELNLNNLKYIQNLNKGILNNNKLYLK